MVNAKSDQQAPEGGLWPQHLGIRRAYLVLCELSGGAEASGSQKRNFRKGFKQMVARKELPEAQKPSI